MLPEAIAKSNTEHAHQSALFAWLAVARLHGFDIAEQWSNGDASALERSSYRETGLEAVPALGWCHAIPNGGSRGDNAEARAVRGAQMKAEGVKKGVADIFLPLAVFPWHGLYIEMKKPSLKPKRASSKGGLSDEQIAFSEYALGAGYGFAVCYSWREAATLIKSYVTFA